MSVFKEIEQKLNSFTKKFYTNQILKGSIFFTALGLIYFFITLFIEYFFWLKPIARTLLFFSFVIVQFSLFYYYILVPLFKLYGFKKGISYQESSALIGKHFPEVADKLTNLVELHTATQKSDLLLASIEQKTNQLKPIQFNLAINFTQNKKYLSLLIIPLIIFIISILSGLQEPLKNSFSRVVDYQKQYQPPAPFAFKIHTNLQVIQGENLNINFETIGKIQPLEAKLLINNQSYLIQKNEEGYFNYSFLNVQESFSFILTANNVVSEIYDVNVIKTPFIKSIKMELNYPNYTKISSKIIPSATGITVPEGTKVNWIVNTENTNSITYQSSTENTSFKTENNQIFNFSKLIKNDEYYQIISSNKELKAYEKLGFTINVIKDEAPSIKIITNIDSIQRGNADFFVELIDDYAINKLQLVYNEIDSKTKQTSIKIPIQQNIPIQVFYQFPGNLKLDEGKTYELYFEVFDNDAVNGNKSTKSKTFIYNNKTQQEVQEQLLQEQKSTLDDLEKSLLKNKNQQKEMQQFQQDVQNKKNLEWNDKNKVKNFLNRQEQYKQMMEAQTEKLKQNLEENTNTPESLQEKKEDLQKRLEELKKFEKQQKLLDEIQKMAEKLNKEDMLEKTKELAQQNRQQERSLERILEMTKRFYVEQKLTQTSLKLDKLAAKQEDLSNKETDTKQQEQVKKEFEQIKEDLKNIEKDNKDLKQPMSLPDIDKEKFETSKELKNIEEEQKQNNSEKAKSSQKKVAAKMKEMSKKMNKSMMEMDGESLQENIDDLRKILENLVLFSFEQENLMNTFSKIDGDHPNFGKNLSKQNILKTHFEHIDDSLYTLSMRLPKLSTKIDNDLANTHYNLDLSLENFAQNRFNNGLSNQQYVMTSVNNLADYLSTMLDNLQNQMQMQMGKGKGQQEFSLPDLIKQQKGLSEKMKDGIDSKSKDAKEKGKEKGDQKGDDNGEGNQKDGKDKNSNGEDGEIFEIYKEQNKLRQQLENALKDVNIGNTGDLEQAKKVLKTMEDLENEIIEKGLNPQTLQKMQLLTYELLKLDEAALEQGKKQERKSNTNQNQYNPNNLKMIQFKYQYLNQIENLQRQLLPLQNNYKKKVEQYFQNN